MRDLFRDYAGGVRQHAARSPSAPTSRSSSATRSCPSFPVPEGHDENSYLRELTHRGRARSATAITPGAARARAHRVRARRHQVDGVLRVLPRRLGPRPLREVARHPRRSGAGERGRLVRRVLPAHRRHRPDQVRPAVRAVPQPGPQADARHRHGLRLPLPRRDDPVRRASATATTTSRRSSRSPRSRRGPRCATRRACSATRTSSATRSPSSCRRSIMGRDTPLHACFEQQRQVRRRLQDGHRAARALRRRSRRQARHRRRARPRGAAPPGRHPRRRGRDHPRAAHRVPADPAQARARHAASRTRRSSRSTRCTASRTSAC